MNKWIVRLLAAVFSLAALVAVAGFWAYQQTVQLAQQPLVVAEAQELALQRGVSFRKLGKILAEDKLIAYNWRWKLLGKLHPELTQIRSGLYEITPSDTVTTLLQRIASGDEKRFVLTLIEGKTIQEWRQYLQKVPHLSVDNDVFNKVLAANGDSSELPEGKFFPDTYQYRASSSIETILSQSYGKMQQQLAEIWQNRDSNLPLESPYELLTLASIIEKETGQESERPLIAAVFINRLRKGMRLQTDPTVIYGMGDRFDGNIRRKDLREATPFNTYVIKGLPPTPIAAPGRESLLAAAHPADVNYLYFVSRNDGSHIFSSTLAEHNRAVDKYQRNR
ncbi:endolytic transglycosylase MltG [Shewanella avicenniae]|uniref:Endolytic murein transglycosylase n=1 Tax=Shewanella avicenniae TaxID=2814294 RepID=A0ABX7QL50_9GAMM|nr:endolytic transglycosylase MltG [Shewanella avicenniae]QSX32176.1 endolytic transglycosylase MltG [Shewanella avicenniae]